MINNIYDLRSAMPFEQFPWKEIVPGIQMSKKFDTKFYGYPSDVSIGKDVFLTIADDKSFWLRHEKENWSPHPNMSHFPLLNAWINNLTIFKNTGRILFFLQQAGNFTPPHIDFDVSQAPLEYQKPSEFVWITMPSVGKKLIVDNKLAPWACWFNSCITHSTIPTDLFAWSLRIDGKFTEEFKNSLQ